jgi:hypothetical protein
MLQGLCQFGCHYLAKCVIRVHVADVQAALVLQLHPAEDGGLGRLMDEVYHLETVGPILDSTYRIDTAIPGHQPHCLCQSCVTTTCHQEFRSW